MMNTHPFGPERRIGHIFQVEGSFADVAFTAANKLPRTHFGEYLGRGEVGEFAGEFGCSRGRCRIIRQCRFDARSRCGQS